MLTNLSPIIIPRLLVNILAVGQNSGEGCNYTRCSDMSNTNVVASQIITLPMYPDIADVALFATAIHDFFEAKPIQ